jgi:hypothetical protein
MARKPLSHGLPALQVLHPRFAGLSPRENMSATIQRLLRTTIHKVRQDQAAPFYPIRTVAAFFDVSFKTISDVYAKLEDEGLLTRLRGAHTLVQGRKLQPRHRIRGVVGVPIYLPGFLFGTTGRAFFIQLEAELRRHHYVADLIFYRRGEEADPDLAERLLEHQLDIVVWWTPSSAAIPTMGRLLDGGIRLVVASDGKGQFPRQQYYLNLERALAEALDLWHRDGVRRVTLFQSVEYSDMARHGTAVVRRLLERRQTPHEIVTVTQAEMAARAGACAGHPDTGIILVAHAWYESLCFKHTIEMEALFRHRRVLLVQGAVYHPLFRGKELRVDSISFDHARFAHRIARDISAGNAWTKARLATFYTRFDPRVDLGRVERDM